MCANICHMDAKKGGEGSIPATCRAEAVQKACPYSC